MNDLQVISNPQKIIKAPVSQFSLTEVYKQFEAEGEFIRVYPMGIENRIMPDVATGEEKELECLIALEVTAEGMQMLRMAQKVLVGTIKDLAAAGRIQFQNASCAIEIRYIGMQKNKRNGFSSQRFDIRQLELSQ